MEKKGTVFSGAMLIAGTAIGGGMLALPVLTSLAGFLPSILLYILCWLFMSCTALLFLEVTQWVKKDSNMISMADHTLGKGGRYFAWLLYLFLFYCLLIAYIVGCGNILTELTQNKIPDWLGPILFVLVFGPLILIPTFIASRLNNYLVGGLAISYFAFIVIGFHAVKPELLHYKDWSKSLMVLPIAFTAFAYHGIIPTLTTYLNGDIPKVRKSILLGGFFTLLTYAIWEWLILGIVPTFGEGGLAEALQKGDNAVYPLRNFIQNPFIYYIGQSFAFFALVTSFIGVSLGLRDFLADGLNIEKTLKGKTLLFFLIFVLPLIIAVMHPHIFLISLDYAGGFGCALLLGLLPILMVWKGRYRMGLNHHHQIPFGKTLLVFLALFVVFEVTAELIHLVKRLFY